MSSEKLFDINEVCRLLGTTSRTLRFYEEKGIISSTKDIFSSRRKYTEQQIDRIRNVMVLRTLGISVKSIGELQHGDSDLKNAVLSKKAEIYASIETKAKEIHLLNEALEIIESGKDIFSRPLGKTTPEAECLYLDISKICVQAILNNDFQTLAEYCSEKIIKYMPEPAFKAMWSDTLKPVGRFVGLEKLIADEKYPHIIYQHIRYEKIGVKIKFVFYDKKISGLWTTYYELGKE